MHLFKVNLNLADIFISELDLSKGVIAYSVRDKETGILLEPHLESKLLVNDKQVMFDSRFIDKNYAKHIEETLNS